MKNKNIWFSVFLLAVAACIVLSALGFFGSFNVGHIILIAFMVMVVFNSATKLWFGGIIFPLGILYLVFGKKLGIEKFNVWETLGICLCVSIALDIIFDSLRKKIFKNKKSFHHNFEKKAEECISGKEDESYFFEKASFSSKIRYVNSQNFSTGKIDCDFASFKIYFDNTVVPTGECNLTVDCNFGSVEIFVPANWRVENRIKKSLAGVEENFNPEKSCDGSVTLIVDGEVNFGSVQINKL